MLTIVPAPVAGLMLQVTPELEESLETVAPVKACVVVVPRLTVAGLMAPTLIGVSGMVMVVVLVVSGLASRGNHSVGRSHRQRSGISHAACGDSGKRAAAAGDAPGDALIEVASPVSVAVMASVAAPEMAVGVVGMVTAIGVRVTVAVVFLVVSVLLVAVMVAVAAPTGVGAV